MPRGVGDRRCTRLLHGGGAFLGADIQRGQGGGSSQLPEGIGQYLDGRDAVAEDFPPDEFLRRISAREGVKAGDADYHARAVLGTLRQAVPSGEMRNVLGHLPPDYGRLFAGTARETTRYGGGF